MELYFILGILQTATVDEIKAAYRRKAREFHPDKNLGDPLAEERFKKIAEAYRILSNPILRGEYDLSFRPVESVSDLFARHPAGRGLVEIHEEKGKAVPRRGRDLFFDFVVSPSLFEEGGVADVSFRGRVISLSLPPLKDRGDCHIAKVVGQGEPGKNQAASGDLFIRFTKKG